MAFYRTITSASLYGMNASYGTTGYMGIPLVIAAFGNEAALPAALATLIHNIPVITIVLLVCESVLVMANEQERKHKIKTVWSILKPVLTNPLSISVIVGIIVGVFEIKLPAAITTFSQLLANASGSTALFAIGLGLVGQFALMKESDFSKAEVSVVVFLKLFFQPMITFVLFIYVFDVEPLWGVISLIMSALPVGAGVFVFAQKYEKMMKQTLTAILVSIIISVITLSIILLIINNTFAF